MTGLSPAVAIAIAVGLVALSAFFVAVEFALVAARRYRLEEAAETSVAARAALRSARDISLLLAGSQLGITLCTLGLGAVAKPAVHDLLLPVFTTWGLPAVTADVVAFVAGAGRGDVPAPGDRRDGAEVVGDRAPGALRDPARAADAGVHDCHPAGARRAERAGERAACAGWGGAGRRGGRAATTRTTCANWSPTRPRPARWTASGTTGWSRPWSWTPRRSAPWSVRTPTVSTVGADAGAGEIRELTRRTGHLRLVVRDGEQLVGVVHVRDALAAPADTRARSLMRPVLTLSADEPAYAALAHHARAAQPPDAGPRRRRAGRPGHHAGPARPAAPGTRESGPVVR